MITFCDLLTYPHNSYSSPADQAAAQLLPPQLLQQVFGESFQSQTGLKEGLQLQGQLV